MIKACMKLECVFYRRLSFSLSFKIGLVTSGLVHPGYLYLLPELMPDLIRSVTIFIL
jgi:hypothetical protein